ncbi:sensor histidine kinase [Bordetella genomosp. 13]|uniref:Sensor histidine kinase n=1 Tax=Bordetella genomosp. 13 TaxID=463040 RepID=A0A1W6ZFU9_9BORD|nr:histidine kinase [Bordetella genomosp. 13]ARP96246.1 sensor histidine kinase [Bordetella genomosp. 13]
MNFRSIGDELGPARASLGFWQAQAAVWGLLSVTGFCIRFAIFGNAMAAFWLTLALEPLAFSLTSAAAIVHARYFSKTASAVSTLACAVLFCVTAATLLSSLGYFLQQQFPPGTVRVFPGNQYRLGFLYYMAIFSIWTLTYFGVRAELAARNARISRMKAETRAVQLELEHLQRQIEPHFLFNALNTIVAEIADRPAIAEEMTRRLADYLRYSLDQHGRGTRRLDEEIDAAETYVRIQALRFGRQLEYESQVDPTALEAHIPHMTLQGLVENAIKHGMPADHDAFVVAIRVRYKDDVLTIEVSNPGRLHAPNGARRGNGLTNLCRRLALYYPERYEFSLDERGGHTVARISLRGDPVKPF